MYYINTYSDRKGVITWGEKLCGYIKVVWWRILHHVFHRNDAECLDWQGVFTWDSSCDRSCVARYSIMEDTVP